jgi:hypothetical protein
VETFQKEGGGGDNLAVGWAKPGESTSAPSEMIPGSVLSPFSGGFRRQRSRTTPHPLKRLGGQILAGYGRKCSFREGPGALGLGGGWKVVKSEMDVAGRELKIWLDFESGSQFACPRCGKFCPVHDTVTRSGGIWTSGNIAPS